MRLQRLQQLCGREEEGLLLLPRHRRLGRLVSRLARKAQIRAGTELQKQPSPQSTATLLA